MRSKIKDITAGNSGKIYNELLDNVSQYGQPHEFIDKVYNSLYRKQYPDNPSLNGKVFEYLICETLAQEGIMPFYFQARFALVPNADFDVICYHPQQPVALSMKVSLRERYKQAVLEGGALQQVYRRARCYLITLSESEAKGISEKIEKGDINGLDGCVLAHKVAFTELLQELKTCEFTRAEKITPITGSVYPVSDT